MTVTQADKKWLNEFIVELRLLDVPGTAIGDAVATVEEHCSDSGESPRQAFGEARGYARSLELPTQPIRRAEMLRLVAVGAMYITGIFLFLTSGRDALSGEETSVTASAVVVLLGFLLLFIVAVYRLEWIVRSPFWQPVTVGGALVAAVVAAAVSAQGHVLVTVPALLLAVIGLGLMVAPPVYGRFAHATQEDPLVDPRQDVGPQQGRSRLANMGISIGLPVGMVLYVFISWLVER